jgi:hypothetical protein
MPRCYLLAVCSGSSLDEDTNNFSLFNLVEQVQCHADAPADLVLPLEVHAYWSFAPDEIDRAFEVHWVLCAQGGIEMIGQGYPIRSNSPHFRMRMFGLGIPRLPGDCEVRVDWRLLPSESWTRDPAAWPLVLTLI